ncbi:MAG: hypothetical protein AAFY41_17645 [Bacteroidota bacterium]
MSERKVEEVLAELGKKIDELIQETKAAGSKVSADMEKQIEKLKIQKEKLEEQMRSSNSNEKWTSVKKHLNDAADALNKALASVFTKH